MMQNIRSINAKRLVLAAAVLLVILLVLLFYARDVIREVVVLPVSYLFWAGGILLRTTPQFFFWIALLLILALAAFRSLSGKRKETAPTPPELFEMEATRDAGGRVMFWAIKVNLMRQTNGAYYLNTFHNTLGKLLLEVLAHRYRLTSLQVEERLRDGTLNVPPEVREYALTGMGRFEPDQIGFLAYLWRRVREFVNMLTAGMKSSAPETLLGRDDSQVARILEYIEEELEVRNDNSGQ